MASAAPTGEKARAQRHYEELDRSMVTTQESPLGSPSAATGNPSEPANQPERGPTPPPYSGPSTVLPVAEDPGSEEQWLVQQQQQQQQQDSAGRVPQRYPGLPRIDYSLYSPPTFELLQGATGIKSTAAYLSASEQALLNLVRSQATVPPKPVIEIRGNRGRRADFDVRCNLMSLLVPDDSRDRLDYLRCVSPGEPAMRGGTKPKTTPHPADGTLEAWVHAYMEDQSHTKCFILERQVAHLDVGWIEGQIRTMVAAMGYRGLVTVNFPVLHSRVIVQSPDRVNRFFTSVSALFAGRSTYTVATAVWPFATHSNGEAGRRCVVQSEETWWREWKDPLRFAIASRRTGWVTNEDKLEAIMEGKGKGVSAVDWGPEQDYGKA